MDYASFWGMTAPQLVLQDVDLDVFSNAVGLLNNPQDSHKLSSLLVELDDLTSFLENNLVFDYVNPEIRKKARQLEQSKLHYETGKAIRPNLLIPKDELADFEATIEKFPKELQPYIMVGNNRKDLSENAVKIIKTFLDKDYVIRDYKRSISINASTEIQVFNRKLDDILTGNPFIIKNRYLQKIQRARGNSVILNSTLDGMKRDILVLQDLVVDNTKENEKKTKDVFNSNISATQVNLDSFDRDIRLFLEKLKGWGMLSRITENELYTLAEIYKLANSFTVEFYNSAFDLDLTEQEYESLFFQLDCLGLVGLNFYAKDFLENSIMNTLLVKPTKNQIDPDSQLAINISEIDRALATNLPFGTDIGGL